MHVSIRPLEDADIPAADAVIRSAFDRPTSFEPMLTLHRAIEPGGVLGGGRRLADRWARSAPLTMAAWLTLR